MDWNALVNLIAAVCIVVAVFLVGYPLAKRFIYGPKEERS